MKKKKRNREEDKESGSLREYGVVFLNNSIITLRERDSLNWEFSCIAARSYLYILTSHF